MITNLYSIGKHRRNTTPIAVPAEPTPAERYAAFHTYGVTR